MTADTSSPQLLAAVHSVRLITEIVGPNSTLESRMLRFWPLPSTRSVTFSLAAILWVARSVYFARLTMATRGSRSTMASLQGTVSTR